MVTQDHAGQHGQGRAQRLPRRGAAATATPRTAAPRHGRRRQDRRRRAAPGLDLDAQPDRLGALWLLVVAALSGSGLSERIRCTARPGIASRSCARACAPRAHPPPSLPRRDAGTCWRTASRGRMHRFNPRRALSSIGLMDGRAHDAARSGTARSTRFGDDAPTQDEMIRLLGQLHSRRRAAVARSRRTSRELLRRAAQGKRSTLRAERCAVAARASSIPLFDPDRLLERWLPGSAAVRRVRRAALAGGGRRRAPCWPLRTGGAHAGPRRPRAGAAEPAAAVRWSSRCSSCCTSSATPARPRPGAAKCTRWA